MSPQRTHSTSQVRTRFLVVVSCLVSMIGCSGDQPPLGKVSGTVKLEGTPLANVEISFIPDVGRPSYGNTDAEGKYTLNYIRNIDGAKVGRHKIHIRSRKVDNDKLKPVEVVRGKNTIDIECERAVASSKPRRVADDEDG